MWKKEKDTFVFIENIERRYEQQALRARYVKSVTLKIWLLDHQEISER